MNDLVPLPQTQLLIRQLDAESLIERWNGWIRAHRFQLYIANIARRKRCRRMAHPPDIDAQVGCAAPTNLAVKKRQYSLTNDIGL